MDILHTLGNDDKKIIIQNENGIDILKHSNNKYFGEFAPDFISNYETIPNLENTNDENVVYQQINKPAAKINKFAAKHGVINSEKSMDELKQSVAKFSSYNRMKAEMSKDNIVKFYFTSLSIIGLYVVFRLIQKQDE